MKPICSSCQRFFRPTKNGIAFIEGMPNENGAPIGKRAPSAWRPYKLWMGGEWSCPDCGAVIIVGCGAAPINEHYREGFARDVKTYGATLQINDC